MTPRNCFLRLTGPPTSAAEELLDILALPERSPRPRTMPENQEFAEAEDEVDEREGEVVAAAERSISERCYSTSFISTIRADLYRYEREREVFVMNV